MTEKSALIAGSGGQGVLFLGKLIAQGAMLDGYYVTWFPSYGAEVRGGTANCTVVVSEEPIGSPVAGTLDVLVVMNEASLVRFGGRLKSGGLLVKDSSLIKGDLPHMTDGIRVIGTPATALAAELGNTRASNMVMLGVLVREGLISEDSAMSALEEFTPSSRRDGIKLNRAAIAKGKAYGGN